MRAYVPMAAMLPLRALLLVLAGCAPFLASTADAETTNSTATLREFAVALADATQWNVSWVNASGWMTRTCAPNMQGVCVCVLCEESMK